MLTKTVIDQIPVLAVTGVGRTGMAAFHAALVAAGVGGYNLVRLSSVIPPHARVAVTDTAALPGGRWGDRLYCVYAERKATVVGEPAWAGIGWVQRLDGEGGLFVEHDGESEEQVSQLIDTSLRDFVAGSENRFTEPEQLLSGAVCTGEPTCALTIAPYQVVPWNPQL